ncbi:MAG: hypothetical protein ACPIOQ_57065, partial [Promethearchaeia archaeon]
RRGRLVDAEPPTLVPHYEQGELPDTRTQGGRKLASKARPNAQGGGPLPATDKQSTTLSRSVARSLRASATRFVRGQGDKPPSFF